MITVIAVHQGNAPQRLVASDGPPFTLVSTADVALHFSSPAAATAWLLARGIEAKAIGYLRRDMPDLWYYVVKEVTRAPVKALTA